MRLRISNERAALGPAAQLITTAPQYTLPASPSLFLVTGLLRVTSWVVRTSAVRPHCFEKRRSEECEGKKRGGTEDDVGGRKTREKKHQEEIDTEKRTQAAKGIQAGIHATHTAAYNHVAPKGRQFYVRERGRGESRGRGRHL